MRGIGAGAGMCLIDAAGALRLLLVCVPRDLEAVQGTLMPALKPREKKWIGVATKLQKAV